MTQRTSFPASSIVLSLCCTLFLSLCLISCFEQEKAIPDPGPPPSPPVVTADSATLYKFGTNVEKWLMAQDSLSMAAVTDLETLMYRCFYPDSLNRATKEEMKEWRTDGTKYRKRAMTIWESPLEEIRRGTEWTFLGVRRDTGGTNLVFRALNPQEEIDYVELLISENSAGNLLICDLQGYIAGIPTSRQIHQSILMDERSDFAKLLDINDEFEKTIELARQAELLAEAGDPNGGLELLQKVPDRYQQTRIVQATMLGIKHDAYDEKTYRKSISIFVENFENSLGIDLLITIMYLTSDNYKEALASINRLDNLVHDPYLDGWRAQCYLSMGNLDMADSCIQAVLSYDSTLVTPNRLSFLSSAAQENYPEAIRSLQRLSATNDSWPALKEIIKQSAFKEFIASPEYRAAQPLIEKIGKPPAGAS